MFFYLSKIFWFFVEPSNLILFGLCLGGALIYRKRDKLGRLLIAFTALATLLISVVPLGNNILISLENRFPIPRELPARIDGIIVLGGVVSETVTKSRGQLSLGGAVERILEFAELSKKHPDAKLLFTSGSGRLLTQDIKEGDFVSELMVRLGVDMDRLQIENQSRNTYENAVMSKQRMNPAPDENWILITSAFHMPRSVGIFREIGWPVIPYPVDYNFGGDEKIKLGFSLLGGLNSLSAGLHEFLGLLFYYLTGKTDSLYPGPDS